MGNQTRPRVENTVNISNKIPYFSIIIIDKNKNKEDYRFNSQEQQSRKNKTSSKDSYFSVIKKDDTVRGSFDRFKGFFHAKNSQVGNCSCSCRYKCKQKIFRGKNY